jgi:hypothetical protein
MQLVRDCAETVLRVAKQVLLGLTPDTAVPCAAGPRRFAPRARRSRETSRSRCEPHDPTAELFCQNSLGASMFRLVFVSVRGPRYLLGNPSVHPVDAAPPDAGTRFATVEQIERYVQRHLTGLSVYWRVEIIDQGGAVVRHGTRTGRNGTGERWTWRNKP